MNRLTLQQKVNRIAEQTR